MRVRFSRARSTVLTVLGIGLLVVSVTFLSIYYFGQGRAGRVLSSASLPPGLGPVPTTVAPTTSGAPSPSSSPTAVRVEPVKVGVPVQVVVAGHRLKTKVSADPMNKDGSLFVPKDPTLVSWGSQQVAPGSGYGTTILVAHINSDGVAGAFSDLAEYKVGEVITVVLADGRRMRYGVVAPPIEVNKDNVASRRQELFDQTGSYGLPGRAKSGRLLLLSCGGAFDNRTGHYESNIFVYAFPL